MKKTFLGLAVACLTFACASEKKASVGDAGQPSKLECSTECKAKCEGQTECTEKKECSEQKTCPMTGKPQS